MIEIVTPTALRDAEKALMESGISEDQLIEKASARLYEEIITYGKDKRFLLVAGCGNNGCDALDCALKLKQNGYEVSVMLVGDTPNDGNKKRREKVKQSGIKIQTEISDCDIIVDGIFGIGLTRAPRDEYAKRIKEINNSGKIVVAVDIPSGLRSDDGHAYPDTVKATRTVTFSFVKTGLIMGVGRNYCGEISVADIGIKCETVGKIIECGNLPKREICSHKGDYGRVKIIGGSEVMVGAPLMSYESALACLRSGAGLVTLCVPQSLAHAYQSRVKETMLNFLPDENGRIKFSSVALDEITTNANAVVIGSGAGKSKEILECVRYLARTFSGTLVVDADALNSIADDLTAIENHKCKLILTPHIGEFSRLRPNATTIEEIKDFALKYDCVLCVKSATTVVTDGKQTYFNLTGTPALAKGGSGDLLCGVISAFSCVLSPLDAVKSACYHFGKCAERVSEKMNSEVSVLASDIVIEMTDNA